MKVGQVAEAPIVMSLLKSLRYNRVYYEQP